LAREEPRNPAAPVIRKFIVEDYSTKRINPVLRRNLNIANQCWLTSVRLCVILLFVG